MNAHLKACAIVAAVAFALIVLLARLGQMLEAGGQPHTDERIGKLVGLAFLALVLVLAFALVPLMVRGFLHLQGLIGNADLAPIRWAREHENGITYGFWTIFLSGLIIAAPLMMRDLFEFTPPIAKSEGTLVATVGMPLGEVRKRSTLKIVEGSYYEYTKNRKLVGDVTFDFEIADSGTRFENCRYYWIETADGSDTVIDNINVGISPHKLSLAELKEANRQVQQKLEREGWAAGQYYYRTEELQTLHSGATSSGRGWYWRKGDTLLHLATNRVDSEEPGEDPQAAGEWIQYIHLSPRSDSSFKGMEFEQPVP
jgi:hypothetical protein